MFGMGQKPARRKKAKGFAEAVLKVVSLVPEGRLASYGQVALIAGHPRAARQVGWVLHTLAPGSSVPWHRVVNNLGHVPTKGRLFEAIEQIMLLMAEGIEVDGDGRMDLARYRWDGK